MAIFQQTTSTVKPKNPQDEALLAELWTRLKAGDEFAFDELARLRYRLLFNYATRFTKDREFIKDAIQDLFLEIWQRRQNLVSTPYVTIYLIKSLRNNIIRKLKQESRLGYSTDTDEIAEFTDGFTVEGNMINLENHSEQERTVRNAIAHLPKRQQEVVFLKFYEGLSNDQIAQTLDIERQTVANFLYRAVSQLKFFLRL